MKLHLGENIRNLRKAADMTQEQLAERLGVSYQSISRWENGGTYPDLEVIPAIAKIFSVSTDALLGIPEIIKEDQAKEAFDALRREALKKEIDADTVNELIRDIRRNHLESASIWRFWVEGNDRCYRHPDILPEVRQTAHAFLDISKKAWINNHAVETMACVEDETHLEEFLNQYASVFDISQMSLKLRRYYTRGEWDKYDEVRKYNLFLTMDSIFDRKNYIDRRLSDDPLQSLELTRFQLDTLHRFCGCKPDAKHPISGNGQLDFWIMVRLDLGIHLAHSFAALNNPEKAFTALEDCSSLLENIMNIHDVIELSCSSAWLKDFIWKAEPNWFNPHNNPDGKEEYNIWIHEKNGSTYMIYPSVYYDMLTNPKGWEGFDSIRNDERYKQITDRIKSLIRFRVKKNE